MTIQTSTSWVATSNLLGTVGETVLEPGSLALLGVAVIGLTLLMRLTAKRVMQSRKQAPRVGPEIVRKMDRIQHAQQTLDQTMLQLDDLSRQVHGQLDTKLARLEKLIRDADRRIERLARMQGDTEGSASLDILLSKEMPHGLETAEPTPSTRPQPDQSGEKIRDRKQTRILALADEGFGSGEIAEKTGIHMGEVELILGLRHARDQVATASDSKIG